MKPPVHWLIQHETGGFPVERAALGDCDLLVLHIDGERQWLVRCDGHDVAEGSAWTDTEAKRAAGAVALSLQLPR